MDTSSDIEIEKKFPKIRKADYKITSPRTVSYNCFAWAANSEEKWWEPDSQNQNYWPDDLPREYSLDVFIQLYEKFGYLKCDNQKNEAGYEKIAIYVDRDGFPSHASRQLSTGKWTSKLGDWEDIEHSSPDVLECEDYGNVAVILKRKREKNS